MIVNVKNLPKNVSGKYVVVRYDENTKTLWYYGSFDNEDRANQVVEELYNGLVVINND